MVDEILGIKHKLLGSEKNPDTVPGFLFSYLNCFPFILQPLFFYLYASSTRFVNYLQWH